MEEYFQPVLDFIQGSGYLILQVLIILIFGNEIIKQLMKLIKQGLLASRMDYSVIGFFHSALNFILRLVLVLICVAKLGIDLTGLATLLSAIGLAIGIAIQDIIGGAANGLMLVNTKPFQVGDYVQIGDQSGTVRDITIMNTILDTYDNNRVILTNKSVFNANITNFSKNKLRRCDFVFGISYNSNLAKAKTVISDVISKNKLIIRNPAPLIILSEMANSSLNIKVMVWVENKNYWTLRFNLVEEVYNALIEANIGIPYPHMTLNFDEKTSETVVLEKKNSAKSTDSTVNSKTTVSKKPTTNKGDNK